MRQPEAAETLVLRAQIKEYKQTATEAVKVINRLSLIACSKETTEAAENLINRLEKLIKTT